MPAEVSPEALALGRVMFIAGPLLHRLPGGPVRDTGAATMPAFFCWLGAPGFVLVSFGVAAMVAVIWIGGMAMAGLVGYFLAVHARYEQQLFAIRRYRYRANYTNRKCLDLIGYFS